MSVEIIKATEHDADAIFFLVQECALDLQTQGLNNWMRYTRDKIVCNLEKSDVYLLYKDTLVIGTITLGTTEPQFYTREDKNLWKEKEDPGLYFETIAVKPSFQGKGYGSKLLDFAQQEALKRGLRYMHMTSFYDNKPLTEYYLRKGFRFLQTRFVEEIGLKSNFYEKEL